MNVATAKLRFARQSAQKCRLAADMVRGLSVEKALDILRFSNKKASLLVRKLVESAIANAEDKSGADIDDLKVGQIFVDEGPTFKRFRARARGRGNQILKRSCHITVVLSEI